MVFSRNEREREREIIAFRLNWYAFVHTFKFFWVCKSPRDAINRQNAHRVMQQHHSPTFPCFYTSVSGEKNAYRRLIGEKLKYTSERYQISGKRDRCAGRVLRQRAIYFVASRSYIFVADISHTWMCMYIYKFISFSKSLELWKLRRSSIEAKVSKKQSYFTNSQIR